MRRLISIFLFLLATSAAASAGSPAYQTAMVVSMQMVQCAEPPRHGGFLSNFVVGSGPPIPAGPSKCPEYEIQGPKVTYRIRPRRDLLLPVGEKIKYRIFRRDILVLTEDANKEIVFGVVGMTLRTRSTSPARTERTSLPHARKCLTMEGDVVPCGENTSVTTSRDTDTSRP